jgi:hypothetical protein
VLVLTFALSCWACGDVAEEDGQSLWDVDEAENVQKSESAVKGDPSPDWWGPCGSFTYLFTNPYGTCFVMGLDWDQWCIDKGFCNYINCYLESYYCRFGSISWHASLENCGVSTVQCRCDCSRWY